MSTKEQQTEKVRLWRRPSFLFLALIIMLGLVGTAAVMIPRFLQVLQTDRANTCVANLKQIDGAKECWALEQKKNPGDIATMADLVGTDKYIKNTPLCPDGGIYTVGVVGKKSTCSKGGTHTLPGESGGCGSASAPTP